MSGSLAGLASSFGLVGRSTLATTTLAAAAAAAAAATSQSAASLRISTQKRAHRKPWRSKMAGEWLVGWLVGWH